MTDTPKVCWCGRPLTTRKAFSGVRLCETVEGERLLHATDDPLNRDPDGHTVLVVDPDLQP